MNYTITKNAQYNSIEILFDAKPAEAIREALKGLKFRWNGKKGVWYGYTTEEEARAAIAGKEPKKAEAAKQTKKPAKINLDGLEKNKKTAYGAEFAAVLRSELKKRGVSGFTIRSNRSGYTDSFTVTFKMEAEDFRSAEEAAARDGWEEFFRKEWACCVVVDGVEYSHHYTDKQDEKHKYIGTGNSYKDNSPESNFPVLRRYWYEQIKNISGFGPYRAEAKDYPELTAAAFEKLRAALQIIQSFNWDNSDPMSDYFDVGFYLDIDMKKPEGFTPREFMTDEEREQLEKDMEAEARERQRQMEQAEREAAERAEEAKRQEEQEKKDRAEVEAAAKVEDLNDAQSYYIFGLAETIGKECNMKEVREDARGAEHIAHIVRRVTFTDSAALEKFGNMLLHDWEFLRGMGGTGTNDPRVSDANFWKLNSEQRGKVEFYSVKCVAVYLGDVLQFVINPEGYSYARYVYLTTENTREATPEESAEKTRTEEAAEVPPFYFPAPVEDQAAEIAARIGEGQTITAYQPDEWISNIVHMTTGELESVEPGTWAQYKGVYMTIRTNKKSKRLFFTDSKLAVVAAGLPTITPEEIAWKRTWSSGGAILKEGRDNVEQMRMIADHCKTLAILDTVQR